MLQKNEELNLGTIESRNKYELWIDREKQQPVICRHKCTTQPGQRRKLNSVIVTHIQTRSNRIQPENCIENHMKFSKKNRNKIESE